MSKLNELFKNIKEKDLNFFFGEGNWKNKSNQYYNFKRVLNENEIIIVTENVKIIKNNYVLVVDNNKVVYLKDWMVRPVRNYENNVYAYAIKLNRNFFKVYTFKNDFEDLYFEKEESFDDLLELAKEQEERGMTVAFGH